MELAGDFCFMGRQRRLRIGNKWYRVDLLSSHQGLRSLVIIDLELRDFTLADAGQLYLYLNYAREHRCTEKEEALAQYFLKGLPSKVVAAEYRISLPDEDLLSAETDRMRRAIERVLQILEAPTAGATLSARRPEDNEPTLGAGRAT